MPHTVNSAIEEFMRSEEFLRLRPATRRRHVIMLNILRQYAVPNSYVLRLDRTDVDAALADRRSEGCMESTMNAYKVTCRLFGRWLLSCGYVKKNPAAHLKNTKVVTSRVKKKPISADQVHEMLKLAWEFHPRDGITVALLIYTGCRAGEIAALTWADVDMENGNIVVFRSKTTNYDDLPMPVALHEHLVRWRQWVQERNGQIDPDWYVAPARGQRGFAGTVPFRMSPEWPIDPKRRQAKIHVMIKGYLAQVGETNLRGKGAHTLRRTAAELLVEATGDIRSAQALLGHKSVTQTEQYLDQSAAAKKYGDQIRGWEI